MILEIWRACVLVYNQEGVASHGRAVGEHDAYCNDERVEAVDEKENMRITEHTREARRKKRV